MGGIAAALVEIATHKVMVGVPASKAQRDDPSEAINNAEIGYLNEHGAPEANIPARPHLVPGARSIRTEVVRRFKAIGQQALSGDIKAVTRGLHAVGLLGQAAVRKRITDGPFEPLADSTLYARQHRKVAPRQGEKPLIDTGQYRNSITYVIRGKGGKDA